MINKDLNKNPVRLISLTPNAEDQIAYCARVSNPANQNNPEIERLLRHCVRHGHWSIYEQANMVLEIKTSRAIAPQILRHRSFSFQEFSQRYSAASSYVYTHGRNQALTNRQSSTDDLDPNTQEWFQQSQKEIWDLSMARYQEALKKGIAKECARTLLPLGTATTLYMNGTIRSWIHYIQLRSEESTQLEHRQIALESKKIFIEHLPLTAKALDWLK